MTRRLRETKRLSCPCGMLRSRNTREDATLLVTWRGPTLRPRGPPLASTWLGAGTITRTGLREITGRVSSRVCVADKTTNKQHRKEEGEGRETKQERKSLSRTSRLPRNQWPQKNGSPEINRKAGDKKTPCKSLTERAEMTAVEA